MSRVFIHVPKHGTWRNEGRDVARVPQVGEYVALGADEPWFRVAAVVHCAFKAPYEAEVFTDGEQVRQEVVTTPLLKRALQ